MMKKRMILLACAMLLSASPFAHQDHDESREALIAQAIDYRQGLLEVLGWNLKRMGSMLEGHQPWDQSIFSRRARDLSAVAHLDFLAGFPDDSVDEDSDAMDEIWLDWENFVSKLDAMREQAANLAKVANGDDRRAMEQAFKSLANSCDSCHKSFKK